MASEDQIHPLDYYVNLMTSGQKLCRSRARHNFPSHYLGITDELPGEINGVGQHDGSFQVTEYCIDCGKQLQWTTLPKGYYDLNVHRVYGKYEGEIRIPREVEATPGQIRAILMGDSVAKRFKPAMRKPVQRKDRAGK